MLLQLALFVEYLTTDIARVLVANVHFVDGGHVSLLVLGDLPAQVAHPRLQRLRLFWRSWNEMCIYMSTILTQLSSAGETRELSAVALTCCGEVSAMSPLEAL